MTKDQLLLALNKANNNRDREFTENFCNHGTFLGEGGKPIGAVVCHMDASRYLSFMHMHDQKIIHLMEAYERGNTSH